VSWYQKGKTNLDFTEARDSGISWAICKSAPSLQAGNHASTPPFSFFTDQMHFLLPNQQHQSTYILHYRKHTHTHTRLTALFPGLPGWANTRKVKPIWILLKQETVSGSGISWAICKSAPRSRQITMHLTTQFFTGQMPFLPPNQQHQSTEGNTLQKNTKQKICVCNHHYVLVM